MVVWEASSFRPSVPRAGIQTGFPLLRESRSEPHCLFVTGTSGASSSDLPEGLRATALLLSCRTFRRCRFPFSLFKDGYLISSDVLKRFMNPARPLHFSAIDFCSVTEAEV